MADLFDNPLSALSFALKADTDADSPTSQALMDKLRKGIETLIELCFGTGDSGTATSDPSETVLTDTAGGYTADEHNGRVLFILSGNAAGNTYTIDDMTSTTITCTGDTLYTDGVRSGDEYLILYDIKKTRSEAGHVHDGVDSALTENALGRTIVVQNSHAEHSVTGTSYDTVLTFNIYIPANPSNMYFIMELKGSASDQVDARFTITDTDSSTATGTESRSSTSYGVQTLSVDCSSLAAGVGTLVVELKADGAAQTAYLKNLSGYWNK